MARALTLTPSYEDRLVAGYAALAIVIHVLEAGFPSLIPGIKPGLANAVTLIVLLRHGLKLAIWVGLLRVLVGSLLVGSFLAPGFWLSLSGAVASLAMLAVGTVWNRALPPLRLSAIGLSVLAALAHMAGQFAVAYGVFIAHPGLLHLLPVLMSAALLFGLATGWVAQRILTTMALDSPRPPSILPP
ncbi:Gx transporter family protein [Sinimarinibacterium sp. NLF-5-8]|uniref:Gx transporter family protein n=1 Tax=Sinimarinibacterium sp. NLF-5-8 TaxID=2698684 RepID=UPI00137BC975|nr:Gx transporter family protein [Sinimarinibacterium sp. NLF-5-8]QHS09503.1 Gx transporter family protein [Sinimarinibacterium sp. NLF-5-8]